MRPFCFGGREAGPYGALVLPGTVAGREGDSGSGCYYSSSLASPCNASRASQHGNRLEMNDRMEGLQGQQKQCGDIQYTINSANVWDVSTEKGVSKTT